MANASRLRVDFARGPISRPPSSIAIVDDTLSSGGVVIAESTRSCHHRGLVFASGVVNRAQAISLPLLMVVVWPIAAPQSGTGSAFHDAWMTRHCVAYAFRDELWPRTGAWMSYISGDSTPTRQKEAHSSGAGATLTREILNHRRCYYVLILRDRFGPM
jgi:hypothetical protein